MLKIRRRVITSSFHPLTWWLWAVLLATTLLAANTRAVSIAIVTSTLILAFSMQRYTAGFHTFHLALRFAIIAFCFRMFIAIMIGVPMPGRTIFTLPQLHLPDFLVGIRIGGPVTTQRLFSGFDEAVLLVALILLFATANSMSNPHGLLRILPKRFYGFGLAGVISTSVVPQAVRGIERVRRARRLRGQSSHGMRSWRGVALPVLEDSLERSIDLAAGLESRGYGYFPRPTRYRPDRWKFRDTLAISGGLYCLVIVIASSGSLIVAPILVALFVLTPVFSS